jgi:hypothetical protein
MRAFRIAGESCRIHGVVLGLALLATCAALAAAPAVVPLRPDPSRLAAAPPELRARLQEDPVADPLALVLPALHRKVRSTNTFLSEVEHEQVALVR